MKYCKVWCISLNCTIHIVCQRQWRGKVFWYFLSLVGYFIARIVCVAWKLVNLKHLSDKRFKNLGWILWQTKNILNLHASSHVCGLSQSLLYHIMSSVVYYKLCCLWYVWYLLGKDAFTSLVTPRSRSCWNSSHPKELKISIFGHTSEFWPLWI